MPKEIIHDEEHQHILPKSESPGSPDSADSFEFSAERLSENAKMHLNFCIFVHCYALLCIFMHFN